METHPVAPVRITKPPFKNTELGLIVFPILALEPGVDALLVLAVVGGGKLALPIFPAAVEVEHRVIVLAAHLAAEDIAIDRAWVFSLHAGAAALHVERNVNTRVVSAEPGERRLGRLVVVEHC